MLNHNLRSQITDIIFLGAGASAADGAPTQDFLLQKFCALYQKGAFLDLFAIQLNERNLEIFLETIKEFFQVFCILNKQNCEINKRKCLCF